MTDLDLRAGQIHRGLGVVARWPDIAVVIPSDSAHDAAVDQMFHELGPEPEAPQIVAAVNQLLAAEQLHSVAMLVEATGGPMAMAFGPVEVLVDGEIVLDGSQGGVRQQVPATASRLILRAAKLSKAAEPVAPYDLRRGVAPGAGLTLVTIGVVGPAKLDPEAPAPPAPPAPPSTPEPEPVVVVTPEPEAQPVPEPVAVAAAPAVQPVASSAPPVEVEAAAVAVEADPTDLPVDGDGHPPPEPAEAPPAGVRSGRFPENGDDPEQSAERRAPAVEPSPLEVPFRSVVLVGSSPPSEPTPLPLAGEAPGPLTPADIAAGRVEVQGVLCPRKHFNNPRAARCMVCGLSLLHLSDNRVTGLRPTLGFIVFDDGSTYGLDRAYVIGREPKPADGAPAQLLVLRDNNETLSRTHATLRLDDWTVQLVDLGSTNGTYVWDQVNEHWNQLAAGTPVSLRSGDTVALGRRTFVFESVSQN
ncbi:MAG: FHA domain-containing protein [Actinomycetota bacterium]